MQRWGCVKECAASEKRLQSQIRKDLGGGRTIYEEPLFEKRILIVSL